MESSDKTTAALQQEVTQLKHKLRVRAQLVSSLQQKSSAKGGADLKQLFEQLEEVTIEAGELRKQNLELANENAILGKALNKLKDQQTLDYSSKELQDALLDVNDELDRTKKQLTELQEAKTLSDQQVRELTNQLHQLESQKAAASSSLQLAELERSKTEERSWKQRYLREVQTTFHLQSAQTTLAEENKCHIEFIAVLEGKIQQLEAERAEHFNRSLCDLHRARFETAAAALDRCMNKPHLQEQTSAAVLRTELACERDVNQELRAELQRIVGKCDDLQSSLAVARANQLQTSMRLEAESTRVKSLEDMRLADICTITRLEDGDNRR